ncbi:hypothetical protein [Methylobacterium sp. J-026]|uniref:hypothetical protein n=1 Tax=Methylobacterium sp. J-026 TaxID=2836624 RepID=UPI001FBAA3AF|nr:hypothetical protein [Methylobacterium sp. J-026]
MAGVASIVTPFRVVTLFQTPGSAGVTGPMTGLAALQSAAALVGSAPRRESHSPARIPSGGISLGRHWTLPTGSYITGIKLGQKG